MMHDPLPAQRARQWGAGPDTDAGGVTRRVGLGSLASAIQVRGAEEDSHWAPNRDPL
jgi:hypothetical protein